MNSSMLHERTLRVQKKTGGENARNISRFSKNNLSQVSTRNRKRQTEEKWSKTKKITNILFYCTPDITSKTKYLFWTIRSFQELFIVKKNPLAPNPGGFTAVCWPHGAGQRRLWRAGRSETGRRGAGWGGSQ